MMQMVELKEIKQAPDTDTKLFKNWFKGSKVVDENGDPMIVYHNTKADFKKFNICFSFAM